MFPMAHEKILGRIRETRGGTLYNSQFGKRYSGEGEYWDNVEKIFDVWCEKLGMNYERPMPKRRPFKRPGPQSEFAFS